jgi:hypothetical protein
MSNVSGAKRRCCREARDRSETGKSDGVDNEVNRGSSLAIDQTGVEPKQRAREEEKLAIEQGCCSGERARERER